MCATFTDDDVGKTVINANGEEVGIVAAVQHGTARVEPDPGITDTIKAALGWETVDDETYPLQEESVSRVTDDEIHLEGDLGDEPGMGTGSTEHGAESTRGADTREPGTGTGAVTDADHDDELIDSDVDVGDDADGMVETDLGDDADRDGGTGHHEGRDTGPTTDADHDDELIDSDVDVGDDAEGMVETDLGDDDDHETGADHHEGRDAGTGHRQGRDTGPTTDVGEDDELIDSDVDVGDDADGMVETDLGDDDDDRDEDTDL